VRGEVGNPASNDSPTIDDPPQRIQTQQTTGEFPKGLAPAAPPLADSAWFVQCLAVNLSCVSQK